MLMSAYFVLTSAKISVFGGISYVNLQVYYPWQNSVSNESFSIFTSFETILTKCIPKFGH